MTRLGFQLNPHALADKIREQITQEGWHLTCSLDSFAHPDFDTGMVVVHDQVDRAVVTFVGSRTEAARVYEAAQRALDT